MQEGKKGEASHKSDDLQVSKRTFDYIRLCILYTLYEKEKTINSIATDTGINWKTVELHLTYLMGKKLVEETYHSEYARIYKLSAQGKEFADSFMETIKKVMSEGKLDGLDADTKRRLRI